MTIRLDSLDNVSAHRTIKEKFTKHQATALPVFLDPAETGDIYSGMVATWGADANTVRICDASADVPMGLFAADRNPIINDVRRLGIEPFAAYQGGPDAYFELFAPAFDDTQVYALVDGGQVPLYSNTVGQVTSDNTNGPIIGELTEVRDTSIIIRLTLPNLV